MIVHIPEATPDEAHLRELLVPGIRVVVGQADGIESERHVLVQGLPSREDIEGSPNLRTVVIPWSGLPRATREILLDNRHIEVHNIHHNAAPAAELAVALLLAAAKRVVVMDRALRSGDWRPRYGDETSTTLDGRTALVLGYGAIGRRVAAACRGLGMHVIGVKRTLRPGDDDVPDDVHAMEDLDGLLPQSSVLVLSVPLTDETKGLIDTHRLGLLPAGAVLVNIARGRVVDEDALFEALRSGALGAAGIDVWYNYPRAEEERAHTPPSSRPFNELDNVVMSPHRGGAFKADDTERRRVEALARVLNALARGGPAPNRVDVDRGY
ncbi:MAG: hydroxyacid dehydrogenase [Candidatus Eisenbacteria bacterium]|nr:hydroxyacid dehydrogenase [Candidatus Eisenbacteria bacterium]